MGRAVLRVAADQVRPVAHAPGAVQVFADQHAAFGQRASPFGLLHLQRAVGYPHGVVLVHHAFLLHGENAFQILAAGGNKGAFRLRGRHRKLAVQLGNVALPQEAICFLHGGDPPQPQLLRQPSLPGTEVPLAAPAWPGPLALIAGGPRSLLLSASAKNDCPCHCTTRRRCRIAPPLRAARPTPWWCIPAPPTAHNRSRCWRHPEPPAGRATALRLANGACCRRYAAASRSSAAARACADACRVFALSAPTPHLAARP